MDSTTLGANWRHWRKTRVVRLTCFASAVLCVAGLAGCGAMASDPVQLGVSHPFPGGGKLIAIAENGPLLVPYTQAGWIGWCLVGDASQSEQGCAPVRSELRRPYLPVIAEDWGAGGPPFVTEGTIIAEPSVRHVSLDGVVIPTGTNVSLPDNLRGVSVEIIGRDLLRQRERPAFVVTQSSRKSAEGVGPRAAPLALELPSHTVGRRRAAGVQAGAICKLTMYAPSGEFELEHQTFVTKLASSKVLAVSGSLVSCAAVEYEVHKFPFVEGVLLSDAKIAPSLPTARPVRGFTGIYRTPAQGGTILVRREGPAWLYTMGGPSLTTQVDILRRMRVRVDG